jgi:hypothetical protein
LSFYIKFDLEIIPDTKCEEFIRKSTKGERKSKTSSHAPLNNSLLDRNNKTSPAQDSLKNYKDSGIKTVFVIGGVHFWFSDTVHTKTEAKYHFP